MNNPLPAALASIKRYSIVYGGEFTQPRFVLVEDREGEVMKAADVIATLPPPADWAVAWQGRYEDSVEGWGEWQHINARDVETYNRHERCQTRPLFAAPPADSAMVEALQECVDWMFDYADPIGTFERIGEMYRKETGFMRPGKDSYHEDTSGEENIARFAEWCKTKHTAIRERARTLLAGRT